MTRQGLGLMTLLIVCGFGCAAEIPAVMTGADKVQLRKSDPPEGFTEIGPISATHGVGCGGFGVVGSHEGAMAVMKNLAVEMKADYVRLDLAIEPHYASPECRDNKYILRGVAFRQGPKVAARTQPEIVSGPGQNLVQSLGNLVGQRVVVHLKSGEVLAGTVAAVTPPDGVQLLLLDQSARGLKTGDIDRFRPAAEQR